MHENWKKYKFGELYDVASGLSKSRNEFGFGNPFVTFKNVFYNYFLPADLTELANTNKKEVFRCSVKKGDLFLTRTSETLHELGMSSVALNDYPLATFNGFCKRLRLKKDVQIKIDPVFIGYYLRGPKFRAEISKHATMTTRASLNTSAINSLEVQLPPYGEQIRIGEILKSLDDKIELNLQMNKTLEEMAMTLYKHLFVDFGPFQDGEFEDSEMGRIPKGWEVKSLYSLANFINGATFKPQDLVDQENNSLPVIKIAEIKQGITAQTKYSKKEVDPKYTINNGDILFPWSGNPHTSLGIFIWDKERAVLNQHIFKVKIAQNKKSYIFNLLKNLMPTFIKLASHKQTTGLGHVTVSNLKELDICVPNEEIIHNFNKEADIILNLLYSNQRENIMFSQTRDTLLPKLISGEVRVKQAEEMLSEVL